MMLHLTTDEKGVAAVIMVIIVLTVLLTLIGGLVLLTTAGYKSCQFSKDRAQALYLAEAGISSAIREIKGDGYLPGDEYLPEGYDGGEIELIPPTSLGDGSYTVRCTAIMPSRGGSEHGSLGGLDSVDHYEYQFTSTGQIHGVSRQAQATYEVRIDIEEFNHIASYTDSCYQELRDAGAELTQVLPVPLMDFFWDNANYTYTTDTVLSGNLEGIHYVKGDARLNKDTVLGGTIIVDGGRLTIRKDCEIDPSNNPDLSKLDFPAIVVYGGTGNVTINSGTQISGLVYASNSVNTQKDCGIKGVIIADNITVGRNNTIEYQAVSPPGFWGGTSASGGTTRKVNLEPESWQSS